MTDTADRLAARLDSLGADAMVLLSPQSYTYATGFRVPSHPLMRWRHAAAIVGRAGLLGVLSVDMEQTTVELALPGVPVYVWKEFREDSMAVLASAITELVGAGARIGIERDFVPIDAMERLAAHLPAATFVACEVEVERARASKTPSELSRIRRLVSSVDDALADALATARPGETEFEVGQRIISSLYSTGISEHRILIVASGERSWLPNVGPSDRVLQPGDVVRVEVFGVEGGYQAGVARTGVLGEPAADLLRDWEILSGARNSVLAELRPGADAKHLYATYLDALGPLREHAIVFFAHGMGLDLHEIPYISAQSSDALEPGAILGIEPYAMIRGKYGLQVKEIVAVTESGNEVLSNRIHGDELVIIPV